MKCASAMVAVCLCLAAGPAHAQTHPSTGVFLQGGIFASIELLPLVPQLRVVVFGGALSVRPGVSVRWSF